MHSRMARYTYSGDAHDIARIAEEGMLPIFQSQPGFKGYTIVAGDDEIFSLSTWESAEDADAANKAAATFVAESLADRLELKEAKIGELLFSTVLGVSTKAGATA